MLYRHVVDHCFNNHSTLQPRVNELLGVLSPAFDRIRNRKNLSAVPILSVPARTHDIDGILQIAEYIRKKFKHVIVAGAGGSSMSGRALSALKLGISSPSVTFLETVDPDAIAATVQNKDMATTGFIVISKSGATVETIAHFYALFSYAQSKLGPYVSEHFFVLVTPGENPLRQAAVERKIRILDHDPDVGGRFSILTNVGLLPAAIMGLDIRALRKGAASVIDQFESAHQPSDCAPAMGAALHIAFLERERSISVMMPYGERFAGLSWWWRQNWAESLGKSGKGFTPVCAMGPTDQHSQLQLYLDGPQDKFFHIITLKRSATGQKLPVLDHAALSYLREKTTGDIMEAEQKATIATLLQKNCPLRVFELNAFTEEHMGALLMHFMLEVILTAELLSVNPFDQPSVEEGKKLARAYLKSGSL